MAMPRFGSHSVPVDQARRTQQRRHDATPRQRAMARCRVGQHYWEHETTNGVDWLRRCVTCGSSEPATDGCAIGEHMPGTWSLFDEGHWPKFCAACGWADEHRGPRCTTCTRHGHPQPLGKCWSCDAA